MTILGLDIGGANIKAADVLGVGLSRPFELWNHRNRLCDEIAAILREFPQTDQIALTMTAELCDCFLTKTEGVRFILDAVETGFDRSLALRENSSKVTGEPEHGKVIVWTTDGRFVPSSSAGVCITKVAAANWHALATWCGSLTPGGFNLLIDVGSTTSDIIPIFDGRPAALGLTDVGRLQSGELSYSGVWRTPLCAVAYSVPFRDGYCSLAAEHFATTLDIHLLLDHLPEDEQNTNTANGKPATKEAAHDRIARMLCCDRDELSFDEAVQIAKFLADVQRHRLAGSLERVVSRFSIECQNVILSGSGSFLARQLVDENRHTSFSHLIPLTELFSPQVADAACAFAVAQLASPEQNSPKS